MAYFPMSAVRTGAVILLAASIYGCGDGETDAERAAKRCKDKTRAYVYSKLFVTNALAPRPADFPSYSSATVHNTGGCEHLVVSYVDSENLFGGKIRLYYLTPVEYRESTDWWYGKPIFGSFQEVQLLANVIINESAKAKPKAQTRKTESYQRTQEAQRLLNQLGYDAGPTDGILGPKTVAAIKSFQKKRGITPDGKLSEELIEAIRQER